MRQITLLGTGSSMGAPVIGCDCEVCRSEDSRDKRLRCSAMVEYDGVKILIDAGPDFRYQMLREGVRHIDGVLLTHEHKDHTGGIDDLRTYNYLQKQTIQLYCNQRVGDSVKVDYHYAFTPREERYAGVPEIKVNVVRALESFVVGGVQIMPLDVMHGRLPILGYRIGELCYITDASEVCQETLQIIKGCKVLVVNALRQVAHTTHFGINEALEFVNKVKPERAIFTHTSHQMGLYSEISKNLPDGVEFGYDGMKVFF